MMNPSSKTEITNTLKQVYQELYELLIACDQDIFTHVASQKWSISAQLDHLIKSSKPVASALNLPKITFRAFGIPNRDSRSYQQLVEAYQTLLAAGAKATAKYIPETQLPSQDTALAKWMEIKDKLVERIDKNWNEDQLDRYLMPHPILGKLTTREMLYFTIYHTLHHKKSMEQMMENYHLSNSK
ncbi:MAG: DinB family protein [Flammeovirgaceae bacterium]